MATVSEMVVRGNTRIIMDKPARNAIKALSIEEIKIQPENLHLGKAFRASNNTETTGSDYEYGVFDISGLTNPVLYVSGHDYGPNWPLLSFIKNDDSVLGTFHTGETSENHTVLVTETIPTGTVKVKINGQISTKNDPKLYYAVEKNIRDQMSDLENKISYQEIFGDRTYGQVFNKTNSSTTAGGYDDYQYVIFKAPGDDVVFATGYNYGANWPFVTFLDENQQAISEIYGGEEDEKKYCDVPAGTAYIAVNGRKGHDARLFVARAVNDPDEAIDYTSTNQRRRIYNLKEAYRQWKFGEKFPIAVIGDSTTDGGATSAHEYNVIGTDFQPTKGWTTILQNYLRAETGNNNLRIYNCGFSGKSATWALQNIDGMLWSNDYYKDAKMVIISHGINDYVTSGQAYNNYYRALKGLVETCFDHYAQPVMMTHQAGMENYARFGYEQMSIADEVTRKVAEEYGLEVIDKNYFTMMFNLYSAESITNIIPDGCHYADVGHKYVAGVVFNSLVKRTIQAKAGDTIIGFDDQSIKTELEYSSVSEYQWKDVKIITPTSEGFKLEAECSKNVTTVLIDAWIFIDDKKQKVLTSYCSTPNVQKVTVDGTETSINSATQIIGTLDLGLHHIVVSTGSSASVNYLGLKLTDE